MPSLHVEISIDPAASLFSRRLPSDSKKWNAPRQTKVNAVFAGTSNHAGSFLSIEMHVKGG
jgi:hypothetical protein